MPDVELPLTAHLEELRRRVLRALLATTVAFAVCYPGSERVFALLIAPLEWAKQSGTTDVALIGTGVAEAFFTRLMVSFIAAVFLALPVILYQFWMFVLPGLKTEEARHVRAFVTAGSLFFLAGAAFCYYVVLALGFPFFLAEYERIGVTPQLRISEYLSFTSRMLLAFGITFELPVVTFFLARVGIVTHRTLLGFGRYAIVAIFALSAVLTPGPDVASQLLMAAPLLVLYGASIGVAALVARRS
jgi:sec-independent protein translocase protein TatC